MLGRVGRGRLGKLIVLKSLLRSDERLGLIDIEIDFKDIIW